jgi:transmembrane sensor
MSHNPNDRLEAALAWQVRTNDPEFDDWDGFTAWLEEDPANASAYHHLADSEALLHSSVREATHRGEAPPIQAVRPRRRWAVAASVGALAIATTSLVGPRLSPTEYSTVPGEVRLVSLGGQDRLVMNGDTHVSLSGWDRRSVRLEEGQILLRLTDRDKGKVTVRSGDLEVTDVGTVFEVSRDGHASRVTVSEGQVIADPGGAGLHLHPGQRLDTEDGATLLEAKAADPSTLGAWERGQLVYVDETLDRVAADLRRSSGLDISTSAAIRARRFTGSLSVAEIKRDPRSLEQLLGVSMARSGKGWILEGA